jgi:hypothetical protein
MDGGANVVLGKECPAFFQKELVKDRAYFLATSTDMTMIAMVNMPQSTMSAA